MGPRADFWGRVESLAETLGQHSYYELLGMPQDASGDQIREAYYRAVKKLHPDNHARERDPSRKRALVRLYARIGEAHRTLSNPIQRAAYDASLAEGNTRLKEGARRRFGDQARQLAASGRAAANGRPRVGRCRASAATVSRRCAGRRPGGARLRGLRRWPRRRGSGRGSRRRRKIRHRCWSRRSRRS